MNDNNWHGVRCKRCKAPIVFLLTRKGKRMPIDAANWTPGETMFDHEKHVSHFATCPWAAHFRKAPHAE